MLEGRMGIALLALGGLIAVDRGPPGAVAGASDYSGPIAELLVPAQAVGSDWSARVDALIEDVTKPPAAPEGTEEATFAREMLDVALPVLQGAGVRAAANVLYWRSDAGTEPICDVRLLAYRDRTTCESAWQRKFADPSGLRPTDGLGEEAFTQAGSGRTYLRLANVSLSFLPLLDPTDCQAVIPAWKARLARRIESAGTPLRGPGAGAAPGPEQTQQASRAISCDTLRSEEGIGTDEALLEPLRKLLMSPMAGCRAAATRAVARIGGEGAVRALAQIAEGDNAPAAGDALNGLAAIGGERAVGAVVRVMEQGGEQARWWAVKALAGSTDPHAVAALRAALGSVHSDVRSAAAKALGEQGDGAAAEPLVALLEEQDLWQEARKALAKIGPPAIEPLVSQCRARVQAREKYECGRELAVLKEMGTPAVETLMQLLRGEAPEVRSRAAHALGAIGDPRAVELLIGRLDDPDRTVRLAAVKALGALRDPRAAEPLALLLGTGDSAFLQTRVRDALACVAPRPQDPLLALLRGASDEARMTALEALERLGRPAPEAIPEAEALLADPSPEVRAAAARLLVRQQSFRSLPALATALRAEALSGVRRQPALEDVVARFRNAAVSHVLPLLEDGSPAVRRAAASALRMADSERAEQALAGAEADADPDVADAARRSLANVRRLRQAIARLRQNGSRDGQLTGHYVENVGSWTCYEGTLQPSGRRDVLVWPVVEPETVEAFLSGLRGEDPRACALALTGATDPKSRRRVVETLNEMASSPGDREARIAAAQALGRLADESSTEPLLSMLRDPESTIPSVRIWAARGLIRIPSPRAFEAGLAYLLKALESGEESREALEVLPAVSDPRVFDALLRVIEQPRTHPHRDAVVKLLGESGDRRAVGPLVRLVAPKPDRSYETPAYVALERLTGRSYPSGRFWQQWWEGGGR